MSVPSGMASSEGLTCFCGSPKPSLGSFTLPVCIPCKMFFMRCGDGNKLPECRTGQQLCNKLALFQLAKCPMCRYQCCLKAGLKYEEDGSDEAVEDNDAEDESVPTGTNRFAREESAEREQYDQTNDNTESDTDNDDDDSIESSSDDSSVYDTDEAAQYDMISEKLPDIPSSSAVVSTIEVAQQLELPRLTGVLQGYFEHLRDGSRDKYLGYRDARDKEYNTFLDSSKRPRNEQNPAADLTACFEPPEFVPTAIRELLSALVLRKATLDNEGKTGKNAYFDERKNKGIGSAMLKLRGAINADPVCSRTHNKGKILRTLAAAIGKSFDTVKDHFNSA